MKKRRFLTFALALILCLSLSLAAHAELSFESYLLEPQTGGFFGDMYEENQELAADITAEYSMVVSCAMYDTLDEDTAYDEIHELYMETYGGCDGVMLAYSHEDGMIYISSYGRAADILGDSELSLLLNDFDSEDTFDTAVKSYILGAGQLISQYYAESGEDIPDSSAIGANAIPDERLKPRLVDYAELLDADDEAAVNELLDEISRRQELDVVICTMDDFDGMMPNAFADDFYDYNGYGMGEDRDGILFAIDMTNRKWAISTCGYGITAFTDAGQQYLAGEFLPYLSDGDYLEAFTVYAETCDMMITEAREGHPLDGDIEVQDTLDSSFWIKLIPAALIAGFLFAFLNAKRKMAKLKSVIRHDTASNYTREGSMRLWRNEDVFLDRSVTSRVIETEHSSGGGSSGSSTHVSSSGTSHGGSSGSF